MSLTASGAADVRSRMSLIVEAIDQARAELAPLVEQYQRTADVPDQRGRGTPGSSWTNAPAISSYDGRQGGRPARRSTFRFPPMSGSASRRPVATVSGGRIGRGWSPPEPSADRRSRRQPPRSIRRSRTGGAGRTRVQRAGAARGPGHVLDLVRYPACRWRPTRSTVPCAGTRASGSDCRIGAEPLTPRRSASRRGHGRSGCQVARRASRPVPAVGAPAAKCGPAARRARRWHTHRDRRSRSTRVRRRAPQDDGRTRGRSQGVPPLIERTC